MFKNRQTIFLRCPHCEAFKVDLVIVQVYAWKRFLRIFYKEMSLNVHVQPKQEEKLIRNNYQFGIFFFLHWLIKLSDFFFCFIWWHFLQRPQLRKRRGSWCFFGHTLIMFHCTKVLRMWPNPKEIADLVTHTEEILNGKFHFLCAVLHAYMYISILLKTESVTKIFILIFLISCLS